MLPVAMYLETDAFKQFIVVSITILITDVIILLAPINGLQSPFISQEKTKLGMLLIVRGFSCFFLDYWLLVLAGIFCFVACFVGIIVVNKLTETHKEDDGDLMR